MKTAAEAIKSHHVFRHLKSDRPFTAERIQTIIDCARQAPSWMDGQHYIIINITSPKLRIRVAALQPANPQTASCSTFLTSTVSLYRTKLCSEAYDGTFVATGYSDNPTTAVTDASLAAQSVVVAAESLEYDVCFIGGIRFIADDIIDLLRLPEHASSLLGLYIGVPDIGMRVKPCLLKGTVYAENRYPDDAILSDSLKQCEQTTTEFGEAHETLPYYEKFICYYSNAEPKNKPLIYRQSWLVPHRDEKI